MWPPWLDASGVAAAGLEPEERAACAREALRQGLAQVVVPVANATSALSEATVAPFVDALSHIHALLEMPSVLEGDPLELTLLPALVKAVAALHVYSGSHLDAARDALRDICGACLEQSCQNSRYALYDLVRASARALARAGMLDGSSLPVSSIVDGVTPHEFVISAPAADTTQVPLAVAATVVCIVVRACADVNLRLATDDVINIAMRVFIAHWEADTEGHFPLRYEALRAVLPLVRGSICEVQALCLVTDRVFGALDHIDDTVAQTVYQVYQFVRAASPPDVAAVVGDLASSTHMLVRAARTGEGAVQKACLYLLLAVKASGGSIPPDSLESLRDVVHVLDNDDDAASLLGQRKRQHDDAVDEPMEAPVDIHSLFPSLHDACRITRLATGEKLVSHAKHTASEAEIDSIVDATLSTLSATPRIQETGIIIVARLGRVRHESIAAKIIPALFGALASPHVYIRSLAYTETIQLAARQQRTAYQMTKPFLASVSIQVVDMMESAPHVLVETARLLGMSAAAFLQITLDFTVPHLIGRIADGEDAISTLQRVAGTVGQSIPTLCLSHVSAIFRHFMPRPDKRDKALDILLELLGSRAVSLQSLLRSRLHEVLGYLVSQLGSSTPDLAVDGLTYVHALVGRRNEALSEFLRDEVLAVLTWLTEELASVHGKTSLAQKVITTRSIGELAKIIGSKIAWVAPQVLACLNSTLKEPGLALASLQSWLLFVSALKTEDTGPLIGPTVAALLAAWPALGATEREAATAVLRHVVMETGDVLVAHADGVPSLDQVSDAMPDIAQRLRAVRREWADEEHLSHVLTRVADDNAIVCTQALHELAAFLNDRRGVVEEWTSGNMFHTLVGRCIRVLLAVAGRPEPVDPTVPEMCLECLGMLGAVDPDRVEAVGDEGLYVLLYNFENAEETAGFALRLLRELVVPAFRATGDTKHQAALAYAIQELLKICGFTTALLDSDSKLVPDTVIRRWEELPEEMLPTLAPLLSSKYVVQLPPPRKRERPHYTHTASFRDWIHTWALELISSAHGAAAQSLFGVFSSAMRDHDVTVARYLLPHLVLHTLISGDAEQRAALLTEFNAVLADQVDESSGYPPERRLLTAQTVFALLDHVAHWMRRVRLAGARSKKRAPVKSAALTDVQRALDSISSELLAQASLRCHAFARSLLNFEYRIRELRAEKAPEHTLQPYYETLHEVYAALDEPDGMEGISTCVLAPSLEHQIREHESTGRWTSAQSCWEVELQQKPDDPHLHLGLIRCLRNLGHYDTLRTHIRGILAIHPEWQPEFAQFQVEGAYILADWASVSTLVEHARQDAPQIAIARVLLAMHSRDDDGVVQALHSARRTLGKPLIGLGLASYANIYEDVAQLHMLRELEMIWRAGALDGALEDSLSARFHATQPSFRTREPLLSIRRSAFLACARSSREPIGECWLLTAKSARRAGHLQTAYSAVLQALHFDAPNAYIQKAKLFAHTDQVQGALRELAHVLDQGEQPEALSDRRARARATLLRARLVEATARFQQNEIVQYYKECTQLDPDSEKIWYHLGRFYDSPAGGVGNQMLLQLSVCRFYMKSAQNGTKFLYRTLPRMLTIWLDAGNEVMDRQSNTDDSKQTQLQFDKINDMMRKSIKHLARYQWFAVLPQLVARIIHKNESVWHVLLEIIVAVALAYPQQSMWALIAGSHSKDAQRKQRYRRIIDRIAEGPDRTHHEAHTVMMAGERLSTELLRLCEYPVGRETTLSIRQHFNALAHMEGTQLLLPLQSSINVTLPPNNVASQGHRPFPSDLPMIVGFDDTVEIMHSLQKPRKITILASNGARYPFLCKPRDDLRKDARLMEFDAMINKLLQSTSESRRRRLYIRTYAVLILNEECGLIEWVPNTVALRHILSKHYAALDIPLYTSDLRGILDEARANPKNAASIFTERVLVRYPSVFHAWFLELFPEPSAWFRARSAYARTAAVMSMVGFVLGLGDRHGDNILFDTGSGDTVHVDLNCLFEKGTTFEVPERVPFRLTHNMVDALGVTGVEGAFRRSAEVTMDILRSNKESLMSVLQAMVHDPLGEWVATERRGRGRSAERSGASAGALKALTGVSDKLDGKLRRPGVSDEVRHSTKNLVHMLICDAVSNQNLAQMYIGWAPYL
ncbi:non-specific serine/threonine protein kinase [Malassezia cuniculi]|uniref:non-specific serine/threonine protein kinase n=1 Tax=Malassezia cuniculi TaxID=948313 RepID=A0AAF0EWL4_9BASI|nr:non-specific serine/threonine protein kinase [Malassezia cuniculi]